MASGRGPLFGRDREMALLRRSAATAGRGEPSGVLLIGEAGVGKTRLATELARELGADGAVVVMSHGVQLSGGELPYAGVAELVRGLIRAVGAAGLTQAAGRGLRALGAFDRSLGDEHAPERAAVTTALLAAVEGLGRKRTLVWIVDDLQWLDAASRDLVSYLMTVMQHARLLLLATARDAAAGAGDGPDHVLELLRAPGVISLHVRPLTDEAVDAQARSLSPRALAAVELQRIRRLSDGLPFFVEELVASDGSTPPTLRKAVTMTTRDLSDATRLLLRAAALEETIARPDLLAQVAGVMDAELPTALAEARERDILRLDRDSEVLRFRHALLREAVEDEMLAGERRALHRRWAEVLDRAAQEPTAPASLVVARARHWYLTGDLAAAHPSVLAAARYVDGVEDHAAQALWWGRVLETWPATDDTELARDKALYQLLLAQVGIGEPHRALAMLEPELAVDSTSDRLRALWLLLMHRHLARVAGELEHAPPAPADADAVFGWLQTLGPDFRANAVLHFLLHEWDGSRPDLYVPICDELARRGEAEDDLDSWYLAKRHQGWWLQAQGDFEGQLEIARTAREVVLARIPSRRLEAEWDWCWGLEEAGRYAEARTAAEAALAQVDEPRAVFQLWTVLAMCLVAANSALGDWETATMWLDRVDRQSGGRRDGPAAVLTAQIRGEIAARKGHLALARDLLGVIDAVPADPAAPWYVLPLAALRAEIGLADRDAAQAEQALVALEQLGHAVGAPDEVVQALLCLARHAEVGEDGYLDRVQQVAERLLPPGGRVQLVTRAELAEHQRRSTGSDTADGWAEVVAGWQALGRVYDAGWCRHLQAMAGVRDGDREGASQALADAWTTAGRLGAEPLRERIAGLARRTRLHLDGLGTDTVADLTVRETQVLRLIALGRTNLQIAEQLVISPKTASVHVSRILAKLGAANRTEAAAVARRLGAD